MSEPTLDPAFAIPSDFVFADVPNRGSGDQVDIHLKGVPCLQTIKDVSTGVGIHF
jgi:hypothetical protein